MNSFEKINIKSKVCEYDVRLCESCCPVALLFCDWHNLSGK